MIQSNENSMEKAMLAMILHSLQNIHNDEKVPTSTELPFQAEIAQTNESDSFSE